MRGSPEHNVDCGQLASRLGRTTPLQLRLSTEAKGKAHELALRHQGDRAIMPSAGSPSNGASFVVSPDRKC